MADTSQVTVRRARCAPEEAARIAAIVNKAYREEGNWTTEVGMVVGSRVKVADVEEILQEMDAAASKAAAPKSLILVAELAQTGEVVGCIEVTTSDAAQIQGVVDGYLGMLAVDSRHGSSGVGRALMAEGERTAAAVYGAPGVVLFVLSARKDILTWYTRRGYVDTGLRHEARELIAACDPGHSQLLVDAEFLILRREIPPSGTAAA